MNENFIFALGYYDEVKSNVFIDLRDTPAGLEYNADYSATYTDRSLIDYGCLITYSEPILGNPAADGYILSSTAAGVRSWVASATVPVDDILDWSTDKYTPYSTQGAGHFDNSSTNPTHTNRLNYDGNLYAQALKATLASTSTSNYAVSGSAYATGSYGVYGNGAAYGIYGTLNGLAVLETSYCIAAVATNNNGLKIDCTHGGYVGTISDKKLLYIHDGSVTSGAYNHDSTMISILDNRSGSGGFTLSGSIFKATIGSTVRIDMNPRVAATGGTSYILDTDNALTTSNILSLKNQGTEKAFVNSDGEVELTTVSKGIILKSADGTRYRLTVANGGTLTITAA